MASELNMTHHFWEDPPDIIAAYLYGSENMFVPWNDHVGTSSNDSDFFDYEHCMRILQTLIGNPVI
jgi:hypothetical protein